MSARAARLPPPKLRHSLTDKPRNLSRIEETLDGQEIEALNQTQPGLGHKLHRILSSLGSQLAAQSGHKGTVGVAEQQGKDLKGKTDLGLDLLANRAGGASDAIDDTDLVTLRQVRRIASDIATDKAKTVISNTSGGGGGGAGGKKVIQKTVCQPAGLSNLKAISTGFTIIHAVDVLNEFIYVSGEP